MSRLIYACAGMMLVFALLAMTGCGPSVEEKKVLEQLNQYEELIVKGGYVKTFERFEGNDDKVFIVEAEIVNAEGLPIGRLRSERVEGFGTSRPRIQWYETPGVSEEWKAPQRGRRGPRRDGGGPRGDGGGPRGEGGGPRGEGGGPRGDGGGSGQQQGQ